MWAARPNNPVRGDALITALSSKVANFMSLDALTAAAAVSRLDHHVRHLCPGVADSDGQCIRVDWPPLNVPVILDGSSSIASKPRATFGNKSVACRNWI